MLELCVFNCQHKCSFVVAPPSLPRCREARLAMLLQRQQRFLLPAIGLLSNMAEDPGIQRKMVKRVSVHIRTLYPLVIDQRCCMHVESMLRLHVRSTQLQTPHTGAAGFAGGHPGLPQLGAHGCITGPTPPYGHIQCELASPCSKPYCFNVCTVITSCCCRLLVIPLVQAPCITHTTP